MALSNEDKKDVAVTFGKKAADAVSSATRDYATAPASKASKFRGKHSTGSNFNAKTAYENLSRYRRMSGDSSKSKALKSKTSISLERQSAHNAMRDKGVAEHWMRKLKND